ncbi:MAG: SAM-dependent methyltransferase [Gemmatimonadota bacterium]
MTDVRPLPRGVDPARPAPARIYDFLLNGRNHFQADREAAQGILTLAPELKDCAWANRGFHQRAAKWIAERGVRQFLDIGSGLPTVGNTHEVVQKVTQACRVVYVDNDPMVRVQAGEILTDRRTVRVVRGDLREPDALLADEDVRDLIDFSQPTGLLMTAVVHFVADEFEPGALIARYVSALAPGSYLALSHLTSDYKPERTVRGFCRVFDKATEQMHFRSRDDVAGFFAGLTLVPPRAGETVGRLCYAGDWGADDPELADSDGSRWLYCGVARRD